MKKVSRGLSILMALCLLLSLGTVVAFADETGPVYNASTGVSYETLDAALDSTAVSSGNVIYVEGNAAMEASATIPFGVQVIVASTDARNDTINGNNVAGGVSSGYAYSTLSIPAGVTLTVDGILLVAGNQQSTQPKSGCLTGNYGAVELEGTISVNGSLYARGLITGNGTVKANSSSSIYQLFQISDWRGGLGSMLAYWSGVFPFNLYEIKNIQSNAVYYAGSNLIGKTFIRAGGYNYAPDVSIIGINGLLHLSNGNIETSYSSGILTAVINGSVQTGDLSIDLDDTYDTSSAILPFGYNMDVQISENSSLTIANQIKLLPGCDILNNGTLNIPEALYVYNVADYSSAYNFAGWGGFSNATVSGAGVVNAEGIFAQSSSDGYYYISEFQQSGYTPVDVPFAPVS